MEEEESWGTFLNSQHFKGRKVCWIFKMGLGWTHKRKFKVISTCITKKKKRLVQIERKWCNRRSRHNLKHKLHPAHNLWEKHHSPPYNILCASLRRLHPNVTFSHDSQVGVPKLRLLLSQNFGRSYLKPFSRMWQKYLIALENIFPSVYNKLQSDLIWPMLSRDLWLGVKLRIWLLPFLLIKTHANQVQMNNARAIKASMLQDLHIGVLGVLSCACLPFNQGSKHSQLPHECNSLSGSCTWKSLGSFLAFSLICENVFHT
jgi:hypothetical protein